MGAIKIDPDQIFFRQMIKKNSFLFPKFSRELINSKINRKDYKIYYNIGDLRWGKPKWLINYYNFNKRICKSGFKFFEIDSSKYHDLNSPQDWNQALYKFKKL